MTFEELEKKWRPVLMSEADTPDKLCELIGLETTAKEWHKVQDNNSPFQLFTLGVYFGAEWQQQQAKADKVAA